MILQVAHSALHILAQRLAEGVEALRVTQFEESGSRLVVSGEAYTRANVTFVLGPA